MKISKKTLLEGEPQDLLSSSAQSASSSRGTTTLNPEATAFSLPLSKPKTDGGAEDNTTEAHPLMNGDVGKLSSGDFGSVPTNSESHNSTLKFEMDQSIDINCPGLEPETSSLMTTSDTMDNCVSDGTAMSESDMKRSNSGGQEDLENTECEGLAQTDDIVVDLNDCDAQGLKDNVGNDDTGQLEASIISKEESQHAEVLETESEQNETDDPKSLTREQIKLLVSEQVEYFFSRENWSSDRYLLSQMDSDQYVPVYILANCSQFKNITKDHSIILDSLKESLYVQLDEEHNRVRPNYKRCIVILREIAETTPVKDIEAMFEGDGCPKAIHCEFVHNATWYVTFESDNDAQKAYRYLRETVKTFCGKPILARIKTKPMSRIGCLSVLPSYTGKPMGDQRENTIPAAGAAPNPAPYIPPVGPSGMPGVPNPPPPPPNAFQPTSAQRVYFPPNGMNPNYNYNYTGSPQIPTAFFYPNPMMQWPTPNFYDINSFIQYNGLSPRATFKPPTTSTTTTTTRNKNRDNKNETRHGNNGSNLVNQARHSIPGSHPPSAQSPHTTNHLGLQNISSHHSYAIQSTAGDNGCSNPRSSSSGCSTPNNNGSSNNFAQSDYRPPSQPNSFAPYCPVSAGCPVSNSNIRIDKKEKMDPTVCSGHISSAGNHETTNLTEHLLPPPPSDPLLTNCAYKAQSQSAINANDQIFPSNQISNVQSPLTFSHSAQHHHQSVPILHRNSYSNEAHNVGRDSQSSRQLPRGGRRRVPRRDEDSNGHSNNISGGRGLQRGSALQGQDNMHSKPVHEARKPQFELQSNLFPPLPTAEEVLVAAYIPEEKVPEVSSQTVWAGDTHKFSDVMKGTVKPKPSNGSSVEKEITPDFTLISPAAMVDEIIEGKAAVQLSTSCSTSQASSCNNDLSNVSPPSGTNYVKPSVSPATSESSSKNVVQNSVGVRHERAAPNREQRPVRDERRAPSAGVRREQREYVPGIGRGGQRRENNVFSRQQSGNKENRPQGRTSWREERPDPDGWITKAPRENRNNRDHRYQQQSHNSYENKSNANSKPLNVMVNGDSSPPDSPKPEVVETKSIVAIISNAVNAKVETNNTKNSTAPIEKSIRDEIIKEKENSAMNNNEGEHKPSWAKMALASKDKMERLSAELKEKEEQERMKKNRTARPATKLPERPVLTGREREGKPFRREPFVPKEKERDREIIDKPPREFRGPETRNTFGFRPPREAQRPKSPK